MPTRVQVPFGTSKGEGQRIKVLHHIIVEALTIEKTGNYIKNYKSSRVVAHAFNPSTWEAEAGGSL